MAKGRFSNLEFEGDDARDPRAEADKPQAAAQADGARHFVAQVADADSYMQQAESQELAGDHENALRSYSAALGENHLLLDAWVGQVRMLLELEEYPEARIWADKALEKFPDHPQLLAAKSVALHRMGNERDALGLNDTALQARGESVLVWVCRGELMFADNRPAAVECFNRAIRLPAPKGPTLMQVGAVLLRCGEFSLALSTLQKAAAQLPDAARVWYLLGRAQEELGLLDQARVSYQQARDRAPRLKLYKDAAGRKEGRLASYVKGTFRRWFGR